MRQSAAVPPAIKKCSELSALLQIFTSFTFNNLSPLHSWLITSLAPSTLIYMQSHSQLHIPMFMLRLLCCLLTRVHYLLKQEGCSRIKHILPVAAGLVEPITGGKDVSLLPGGTCCFHVSITFGEELAPTAGKGLRMLTACDLFQETTPSTFSKPHFQACFALWPGTRAQGRQSHSQQLNRLCVREVASVVKLA